MNKGLLTFFGAIALMFVCTNQSYAANAAVVNGHVITQSDVNARGALLKAIARKRPDNKFLINELIEERLKLEEASRLGVSAEDEQINKSYGELAKNNKFSPQQLSQMLSKLGTSEAEFKKRLSAEIGWAQVVRAQVTGGGGGNLAFLPAPSSGNQATEYQIRQVVFTSSTQGGRMAEAQAARARFKGCDAGFEMLKGLRDVAVKPPISRSSLAVGQEIEKLLNATPAGSLTQPIKSRYGTEMYAVCDKNNVVDDALFGQQRLQKLQNKTFTNADMDKASKTRLKELKDTASITYN